MNHFLYIAQWFHIIILNCCDSPNFLRWLAGVLAKVKALRYLQRQIPKPFHYRLGAYSTYTEKMGCLFQRRGVHFPDTASPFCCCCWLCFLLVFISALWRKLMKASFDQAGGDGLNTDD